MALRNCRAPFRSQSAVNRLFDLEDLIRHSFQKEEIDDYSCTRCKKKTKVVKQQTISRLPKVLILHVNRLDIGEKIRKTENPIEFPIADLDMSPFCAVEIDDSRKETPANFNLVAGIAHKGTSSKGHYTAYCWEESVDSWVEFNDCKTRVLSVAQVELALREHAHMLIYQQSN